MMRVLKTASTILILSRLSNNLITFFAIASKVIGNFFDVQKCFSFILQDKKKGLIARKACPLPNHPFSYRPSGLHYELENDATAEKSMHADLYIALSV